MKSSKKTWSTFSIVASILGFIIDAATLTSWFIKFNFLDATSSSRYAEISIPIHFESITLAVLLYTFIGFGVLWFSRSHKNSSFSQIYSPIMWATIPLFLMWGTLFRNLDVFITITCTFIWANIYFGYLSMKIYPIPISNTGNKVDYSVKVKEFLASSCPRNQF